MLFSGLEVRWGIWTLFLLLLHVATYKILVRLANLCKFEPVLPPNNGSPLVDWLVVVVVEICILIVGPRVKYMRRS